MRQTESAEDIVKFIKVMLVIYIHLPFSVEEEETLTFYYLQGFFPSMLYKDSTTCVQ